MVNEVNRSRMLEFFEAVSTPASQWPEATSSCEIRPTLLADIFDSLGNCSFAVRRQLKNLSTSEPEEELAKDLATWLEFSFSITAVAQQLKDWHRPLSLLSLATASPSPSDRSSSPALESHSATAAAAAATAAQRYSVSSSSSLNGVVSLSNGSASSPLMDESQPHPYAQPHPLASSSLPISISPTRLVLPPQTLPDRSPDSPPLFREQTPTSTSPRSYSSAKSSSTSSSSSSSSNEMLSPALPERVSVSDFSASLAAVRVVSTQNAPAVLALRSVESQVRSWSVDKVLEWLIDNGLPGLVAHFRNHNINGAQLISLDASFVQGQKLGLRKSFLKCHAKLLATFQDPFQDHLYSSAEDQVTALKELVVRLAEYYQEILPEN